MRLLFQVFLNTSLRVIQFKCFFLSSEIAREFHELVQAAMAIERLSRAPLDYLGPNKLLVTLSPRTIVIVVVFLVAAASLSWLTSTPRQRYVTGVHIVGGADKGSIKRSRMDFVHNSMRMLLDGYRKVCDFYPHVSTLPYSSDLLSIDKWRIVLCPEQAGRALNAACQVSGRSQISPST